MHVRRLSIGVALAVLTFVTTASAQPVSRLKGRVASEEGNPISDADIRIEAIWGFIIALAARQAGLARTLFLKAVDRDPSSFQAALGSASSALMLRDFDAASRAFAAARDRTKDKDEKYLTAAVGELAKIVVPTR
jgi:hypothetical protein